jgi:hypothetical protein
VITPLMYFKNIQLTDKSINGLKVYIVNDQEA